LDIVESRQELKITAPVGTTMPLFAGAVGKVFLASMDAEHAARIIKSKGLPKFTENSIVDSELYDQELRRVKQEGFAVDDEEYILGVRAVASPIKGLGQLKSAIWAVGFKASLDEKRMQTLIRETKKAAEFISRRIQKQILA
jgi:DNA-binding IclR family transcriptional regulator